MPDERVLAAMIARGPYLCSPFSSWILEIFESEIRQNILDYQWMLGNCHDCSS